MNEQALPSGVFWIASVFLQAPPERFQNFALAPLPR